MAAVAKSRLAPAANMAQVPAWYDNPNQEVHLRKRKLLLLAVPLLLAVLLPAGALAGDNSNPQLTPRTEGATVAAVPYQCIRFQQNTPDHQLHRRTHNEPFTYTASGWNNVRCGSLSFSLSAGQQALVDLSATAELDCNGPDGNSGWCEGRFLVNGNTTSVHPSNEGLGDSYAWDSSRNDANGIGVNNWSAHPLDQVLALRCAQSTGVCTYRVQLQTQLTAGATSLWLDDLTVKADIHYGAVSVSTVAP